MDEHDERTSLVRSGSTLNRDSSVSYSNNNDYNAGLHHRNDNQAHPSRTSPNREDFARRDPRTFLIQIQRSLALFQNWAAKVLHGSEESPVVNWVQNARVARTFMMIINVILSVLAFLLMAVEVIEMTLREPILDYLLPESELTLFVAGLTIVTGAFGFAVAYNLLVEDATDKGDERDDNQGQRGNGSGGDGRDSGPRAPTPPRSIDNMLGQNNNPPLVLQQQQTKHPRLMFTQASTYLLNGNTILLAVVLIFFTISLAQRSVHLSQMDKELNKAWTEANRHSIKHISEFQLRHQCCGYNHVSDRSFPAKNCDTSPPYEFKVPCRADLTKDFKRWQQGIQLLMLTQLATMLPLFLLVMSLSAIGSLKLKERKREGPADTEAEAEATAVVSAVIERGEAQSERRLLENVAPHNGGASFLIDVQAEPVRIANDRPLEQTSLI